MDWQDLSLAPSPARAAALQQVIQTFAPRATEPTATDSGSGVMQWLQDNQTIVYTAAAVLVALALLKGRR